MKKYLPIFLLLIPGYSFISQAEASSPGEDEGRCTMNAVIMVNKGMNVPDSVITFYNKNKATYQKVMDVARGPCAASAIDSPCTRSRLSNYEFNFMKGGYLAQKFDVAPPQEPPLKNIDVLWTSCMTQFK